MTPAEKAAALIADPIALGKALGYKDFRRGLHDVWIRDMILGTEDTTLQAHRGSYKTTCLAQSIACMMILYRTKNIMFLRKTDTDVVEVLKNVARILKSDVFRDIYRALVGEELLIVKETSTDGNGFQAAFLTKSAGKLWVKVRLQAKRRCDKILSCSVMKKM